MSIFVGQKCKTQMGLGSQEYFRGGLATVYGKIYDKKKHVDQLSKITTVKG